MIGSFSCKKCTKCQVVGTKQQLHDDIKPIINTHIHHVAKGRTTACMSYIIADSYLTKLHSLLSLSTWPAKYLRSRFSDVFRSRHALFQKTAFLCEEERGSGSGSGSGSSSSSSSRLRSLTWKGTCRYVLMAAVKRKRKGKKKRNQEKQEACNGAIERLVRYLIYIYIYTYICCSLRRISPTMSCPC